MAEPRLPGRAGEKVSERPAGGAVGRVAAARWPVRSGVVRLELRPIESNGDCLFHMASPCAITVRCTRPCSFLASVWLVWMFRMLLLCSITPCPDSGLLEGGKNEEGNRVLTVSPFGLYTILLCIGWLWLVFLI